MKHLSIPYLRVRAVVLTTIIAMLAIAALTACTGSPVREAQNPEARADALWGEYVLAEEAAARFMASPEISDGAKAGIQAFHRQVNPAAELMRDQAAFVARLRIEKPEDVPAALIELDRLTRAAYPLIRDFKARTQE